MGGAEIARTEQNADGKVPLHTLRADIDYAHVEAFTTFGRIGVKVWIYRGEVLPDSRAANGNPSATPASAPPSAIAATSGDAARRAAAGGGAVTLPTVAEIENAAARCRPRSTARPRLGRPSDRRARRFGRSRRRSGHDAVGDATPVADAWRPTLRRAPTVAGKAPVEPAQPAAESDVPERRASE